MQRDAYDADPLSPWLHYGFYIERADFCEIKTKRSRFLQRRCSLSDADLSQGGTTIFD